MNSQNCLDYIFLVAKDAENVFKCILTLAICLLRFSNLDHFFIHRLEDFLQAFFFVYFGSSLNPIRYIVGKFCIIL